MKNFFKPLDKTVHADNCKTGKDLSQGKLYIAHVNRAMIDSGKIYNQSPNYDEDKQYKASVFTTAGESSYSDRIPVILSREEEMMLYDQYY